MLPFIFLQQGLPVPPDHGKMHGADRTEPVLPRALRQMAQLPALHERKLSEPHVPPGDEPAPGEVHDAETDGGREEISG